MIAIIRLVDIAMWIAYNCSIADIALRGAVFEAVLKPKSCFLMYFVGGNP
ncbi:hypothetical protein [Sphingobacterium corticibacterium]|nr:hypothetical protein [Sphingobacterium corticibacterium]